MTAAVETVGLAKRYGRRSALSECTLSIPTGRVVGLVGPNGAGKTTLLHLVAGLLQPSQGVISVLGGRPGSGAEQLAQVGFLAQESPTYARLTVQQHLQMGRWLNPTWDAAFASARVQALGLDPRQRTGTLSGGQRAQLALTLAVAKRPQLLVLDEPVAALDPLARREFLQTLMEVVADHGVSVLLSSHLIADLERVCDHLVVLLTGRVAVHGDVDELLAEHQRLIGPRRNAGAMPSNLTVVEETHAEKQTSLLVRSHGPVLDPAWTAMPVTLDDLVLAYMRQAREDTAAHAAPLAVAR